MMKEQYMHYEAPQVEVIEVEVEKGFAVSGDPNDNSTTPTLEGVIWQ